MRLPLLLVVFTLALNSCSSGNEYSSNNNAGFETPAGSMISININNGKITNNLASITSLNNTSLDCIQILSATLIPISSTDAVTTSGYDNSTTDQGTTTFYLMKYEVSQAQWNTIVDQSGAGAQYKSPWLDINSSSDFGTADDSLPAWGLSKDDIDTVLLAYNANHHFKLRLPTDLEWEYACRAGHSGTATRFSWGDDFTPANVANVSETSATAARNVDSGDANALGLINMHGNVWEWSNNGNLRGGSWADSVISASSGNIVSIASNIKFSTAGLRLIVEAP